MGLFDSLRLVTAEELTEEAFSEMVRDYLRDGKPFQGMFSRADYAPFQRICRLHSQGINLPRDTAAYTRYFLVDNSGVIYAQGDVRHWPTAVLTDYQGYIGYGVLPSWRGRGIGTLMCAKLLEKAAQFGYESVIITCRAENDASRRVIEKNGGVLLDIRYWRKQDSYMRRYQVPVKQSALKPDNRLQ